MSTKTKPIISVIIPLRNTRQYSRGKSRLDDVLKSLRSQTVSSEKIELIISDIDSDPEFQKKHKATCKRHNARHVYTRTQKLWNISRARNIGIQKSRGTYVMTTDVDCVFAPNFIETVLKRMTGNTIIHCRMTELPENYHGHLDNFKRMERDSLQLRPTHGYGSCQIVPRAWAFKVGGFDEEYETWGAEDTDYYLRAKQDGLTETWIENETTYFHQWHSQGNRDEHRLLLAVNRQRCKKCESGKLPIKRNPFGWGGVGTPSVFSDTAIVITTFLRDEDLLNCVKSIRKYYPGIAVYVADGGNHSVEKDAFLTRYNCHHLKLEFDRGVCGSRNDAFKALPAKYKYVLICEDDIVFTPESRIDVWREILDHDPKLGLVGGVMWRVQHGKESVQHYEGSLAIEGDTVFIREIPPEWIKVNKDTHYCYFDIILNVFLMRREVHDDIKWDDKIPQAPEHLDFFLSLKRHSDWKAGYTDAFQMKHVQLGYDEEYIYYRKRNQGFKHFAEKHGIRNVYSDWHRQFQTYPDTVDYLTWKTGHGPVMMHNLISAVRVLERLKSSWFLANGTCLGVVRDNSFTLNTDNVDIVLMPSQSGLWDNLIKAFKLEGFSIVGKKERRNKRLILAFERDEMRVNLYFLYEKDGHVWHGFYSPEGEFCPYVFTPDLVSDRRRHYFKRLPCYVPKNTEAYLASIYGQYWKIPDGKYRSWKDSQAIDPGFFKSRKDVFIPGVWDVLHVGHLSLIEKAKSLKATVIVGVLTDEAVCRDGGSQPVTPFNQRRRVIEAVRDIDRVITLDDVNPALNLRALRIKPDYVLFGSEDPVRQKVYTSLKCKVVSVPRVDEVNTARIQRQIKEPEKRRPRLDGQRVAVGIKTFMREDVLFRTVESFEKHMPYPHTFYIADDSGVHNFSDKKNILYQRLKDEGHTIIILPFACGLSVGRNAIVKRVKENYLLITDDDIMLGNPQTLKKMMDVLDSRKDIGLVSSLIFLENGNYLASENYQKGLRFEFVDGVLYRHPSVKEYQKTDNDTAFLYADQVVNFFIAKRAIFNDVKWDDRIKIEFEHLDFFLALKKTPWKAVACLGTKAVHQTYMPDHTYQQYRRNAPSHYFLQKNQLKASINRF